MKEYYGVVEVENMTTGQLIQLYTLRKKAMYLPESSAKVVGMCQFSVTWYGTPLEANRYYSSRTNFCVL